MSARVGLFEHFKRLLDFKGREDRSSFWPYAVLVYGLMMVGSFAVMIPTMHAAMRAASDATTQSGTAHLSGVESFITGIMILTVIGIALYAAAVVRRLHDAGLGGFWGLMPLPFLLFGMVAMRGFFQSFASDQPPDMARFNQIFINNFIYILTILALILLLARRSDPQPNRFDMDA